MNVFYLCLLFLKQLLAFRRTSWKIQCKIGKGEKQILISGRIRGRTEKKQRETVARELNLGLL